MKHDTLLRLLLSGILIALPTFVTGSGEHKHELTESKENQHDDEGQPHHSEQSTYIDERMASEAGIKTTQVSSKTLSERVILYGNLAIGPEQLSHVRARYSGVITAVKSTIGDQVKRGELLAEIESNESLRNYSMQAPISGTIIQRHANTGEVTRDQVLFSIANFDNLWAEFRVYPTLQTDVRAGQVTYIETNGIEISSTIEHIIPVLDKPYLLARAKIEGQIVNLTPGLLVEGNIVINEFLANLAVEKNSLHTIDGTKGVFVKSGDEYKFTPLTLGRRDNRFIEVLSGLTSGEEYVYENSYLIKADIEKSEAEHEH